jgi:hypothetical protein
MGSVQHSGFYISFGTGKKCKQLKVGTHVVRKYIRRILAFGFQNASPLEYGHGDHFECALPPCFGRSWYKSVWYQAFIIKCITSLFIKGWHDHGFLQLCYLLDLSMIDPLGPPGVPSSGDRIRWSSLRIVRDLWELGCPRTLKPNWASFQVPKKCWRINSHRYKCKFPKCMSMFIVINWMPYTIPNVTIK